MLNKYCNKGICFYSISTRLFGHTAISQGEKKRNFSGHRFKKYPCKLNFSLTLDLSLTYVPLLSNLLPACLHGKLQSVRCAFLMLISYFICGTQMRLTSVYICIAGWLERDWIEVQCIVLPPFAINQIKQ